MLLLMINKLKELVKNIKEIHKHSTVMIENTKEEYLEWLPTNQIIAEEDYPNFLKALERERIKGGTQNVEVRIRDIEFHYQWYRLHLDSQYNDQGEMIAIVYFVF